MSYEDERDERIARAQKREERRPTKYERERDERLKLGEREERPEASASVGEFMNRILRSGSAESVEQTMREAEEGDGSPKLPGPTAPPDVSRSSDMNQVLREARDQQRGSG